MKPGRLPALLLATLLVGCGGENCPTLPGGVAYCLQPSASGPEFSALQQVVLEVNGQREILLARIENSKQRLAFVGLTPLGQTVLSLTWDGQRTRASWLPGAQPRIEPAALVALLQLALWPADATRRGLSPEAEWVKNGNGLRLSVDGRSLVEIDRTGEGAPFDTIAISLPTVRLRFDITTLPEENDASTKPSR